MLAEGNITLTNGPGVTIRGTLVSVPVGGTSGATINVPQSPGLSVTLQNTATLIATTIDVGQCAAVYNQKPPMVNASRKPGEWQTYDIVFEAPRFKDGKLVKPAFVTVFHNGVLVQNHTEIKGEMFFDQPYAYTAHAEKLPLQLLYHNNPVRFRNIWIREIAELEAKKK